MRWFLWWDVLWNWEIRFSSKNKPLGIGPHVSWRSYHPTQRSPRTGRWTVLRLSTSGEGSGAWPSRQCLSWAQDTCGHLLSCFLTLAERREAEAPPHTSQRGSLPRVSCLGSHPSTRLSLLFAFPPEIGLEESWGWSVHHIPGVHVKSLSSMLIFKGRVSLNLHSPKTQTHASPPCRGSPSPGNTLLVFLHMCPHEKTGVLWRWGAVP